MTVLWVAFGAAVGAPLRYLVDRGIRRYRDTTFPWGTLAVNLAASLVLGALVGAGTHVSGAVTALAGTGFCGALSTYSTFGYENQQLTIRDKRAVAVTYLAVSVVIGIAVAALGWQVGQSLG
jgi:fluoride exporter